jgi:ferredoxin-NADP reductase
VIFGAIVGALSSPNVHFGGFYLTPEIAFLVGNAFAYAVSPEGRFKFTLLRIERIAADCYEFVLKPDRKIAFQPGQYLDWTLDVRKPDDRGNRRPFTIASAPGDEDVRLGVKFYSRSSAFKQALAAMKPGDVIYGSQLAGAFTLPANPAEKLAFIAGGIGVTPFRSMVQDLLGRQDKRSAVLIYGANKADEIAYADLFEQAEKELGLRTVYAVADSAAPGPRIHNGFIDAALIRREIPDFRDRTFYISGPWAMVSLFQRVLKEMGVARSRIKVDFFPGLA